MNDSIERIQDSWPSWETCHLICHGAHAFFSWFTGIVFAAFVLSFVHSPGPCIWAAFGCIAWATDPCTIGFVILVPVDSLSRHLYAGVSGFGWDFMLYWLPWFDQFCARILIQLILHISRPVFIQAVPLYPVELHRSSYFPLLSLICLLYQASCLGTYSNSLGYWPEISPAMTSSENIIRTHTGSTTYPAILRYQ